MVRARTLRLSIFYTANMRRNNCKCVLGRTNDAMHVFETLKRHYMKDVKT